jgi:hypothetical protein
MDTFTPTDLQLRVAEVRDIEELVELIFGRPR